MPFNGSGTFVSLAPPDFPALPFTTILASMFNANLNDIFTNGLTNCLTRDGQSVPFANLPMGGFKLTGLAAGSADTDSARLDQGLNARGAVGSVNWDTRTINGMYEGTAASLTAPSTNFPPTSDIGQLFVSSQGANIIQLYITANNQFLRQRVSGVWSAWTGLNSSKLGTGRNLIINGNFDLWDYGTTQTTSGYGSANRWRMVHTGTTKTATRVAWSVGSSGVGIVPNNTTYFSRNIVSSVAGAGNSCGMQQFIESVNTGNGKSLTVSFIAWVATGTANLAVNFTQIFGTGGSPSAAVSVNGQKVALTSSPQLFSLTFSIPSIAGKTLGSNGDDCLQIQFWFDAGSNFNAQTDSLGQQSGTFNVGSVQVEYGAYATPFEVQPPEMIQAQCARYYQVGFARFLNPVTNGSTYSVNIPFNTRMRAIPTVTFTNAAATNFPTTAGSASTTDHTGTSVFKVANGTGGGVFTETFTASAEY